MYKVNTPDIIYDRLDDAVIIIDGVRGLYYALSGYSTYVFCAIADGCDQAQVCKAFEESGLTFGFAVAEAVESFVGELVAAGILVKAVPCDEKRPEPPALHEPPVREAPHLTCFDDLQELLLIDPIHQVDVQEGWPFTDKDAAAPKGV